MCTKNRRIYEKIKNKTACRGGGTCPQIVDIAGFSPITLYPSQKYSAFTLAEVLITLGVIGVVAAMTMPVIVANVKEKSLESALKKAQSSLINGYKQMMAKESVFQVSNLPIMSCARSASCFAPWHRSTFKVVDDNTSGFTGSSLPEKYALEVEDEYGNITTSDFRWSDVPYLFRTADGMSYGVELDDGYNTFSVYADTNGAKSPNTVCKDMLKFRISGVGNIANVCGELGEDMCSLDKLHACNPEQCWSLYNQGEYLFYPNGNRAAYGIWNRHGHFITFACDKDGAYAVYDYCDRGDLLYCR